MSKIALLTGTALLLALARLGDELVQVNRLRVRVGEGKGGGARRLAYRALSRSVRECRAANCTGGPSHLRCVAPVNQAVGRKCIHWQVYP